MRLVLLCSVLMMAGCSNTTTGSLPPLVPLAQKEVKTTALSPAPKKMAAATQATPKKPPQKAPPLVPGGQKSGTGSSTPPKPNACPDVTSAVYAAIDRPSALPPPKAPLTVEQTKAWIGQLEDQVADLKGKLKGQVEAYKACKGA